MGGSPFVEIRLDATRVAFPLAGVDRVIRAVAITPIPGSAPCLLGVVDVHGTVVPVYDTRRLLGLPPRALRASDHILLTRGAGGRGFVADEVRGLLDAGDLQRLEAQSARAAGVRGVARREDGLVLIQDMQRFMALERAIPLASHA